MKRLGLLLGMVLMTGMTWAAPLLEEVVVYETGAGDYHGYRIPAVIQASDGTVLAFAEGRRDSLSDHGVIDLVLRRSSDQGKTWGPMEVVVHDDDYTCGNPVPIVDRDTGVIWLAITKNKADAAERDILKGTAPARSVWILKSEDHGKTWSEPVDWSETLREEDWRWYATGPCHGIQLKSGRLVIPANHSNAPHHKEWFSHIIYSDDHGETWQLGATQGERTNESTVLELADGRLYQNMRNYRGTNQRAYAYSEDGGESFGSVQEDTALVSPVCQASVIRYSLASDGDGAKNRILFSNPASKERKNLTIRMSEDETESWGVSRTLHGGPAAYSDLVVFEDGVVGCLYEKGEKSPYETITFARFNLEWLQGN